MGRGQELLDAARNGDKRTVEKILGQITKRSGPFTSLRRGAGVNVQDDNGYTPLHHACLNGHKEIVRLLLAVDASPCIADKRGATPLHLAAWKGESEIVAKLLAHKNPPVNVDQVTADHETALLSAAHFGYTDVVKQLIDKGADVTIRNIRDESALDLAAQYGRLETVQYLLDVMPTLVEPYKMSRCRAKTFSTTPLHRASKNGRKEVVQVLLAAGMDPNIRTYNLSTPLHEAACFGKASVVRILLANGADLNAVDRHGKSVHNLLSVYSEEATRKVRRVIREYENRSRLTTYESEEELPPFPVQGYSPNIVSGHDQITSDPVDPLCPNTDASLCNINFGDYKKYDPVSNADSLRNYKTLSPLLKKDIIEVSKKFRERSLTYTANNKSNAVSNTTKGIYVNQIEIECSSRKKSVTEDAAFRFGEYNPDFEVYENLKPPARKDSDETSPFLSKKKPKPLPKPPNATIPAIRDNNLPVRKSQDDKNYVNQTDSCENTTGIAKRICLFQTQESQDLDAPLNPLYINTKNDELVTETDTVYMNTLINLPDDEKVKKSGHISDDTYLSMDKSCSITEYVQMDGKMKNEMILCDHKKNIAHEYYHNMNGKLVHDVGKNKYLCMDRRKQYQMRRRSNPVDLSKQCEYIHMKGDDTCIYEPLDYLYIYDLNPDALCTNTHPFIRKKEKANSIPCLCAGHDGVSPKINPKRDKISDLSASQLVYYSCEDIYVKVNQGHKVYDTVSEFDDITAKKIQSDQTKNCTKPFDAEDDAVNKKLVFKAFSDMPDKPDAIKSNTPAAKLSVFKKKIDQMKTLFTDWNP